MSEFKQFRDKFQANFEQLAEGQRYLFVADVSVDDLWELYLESFPKGTNDVFRERRHHDCSCCKHFIRQFGNVVAIIDDEPVSIWRFDAESTTYQPVIDALADLVESRPIADVFVTKESGFGTSQNHELLDSGEVHTWHHFRISLPARFVSTSHKSEASIMAQYRDSKSMLKKSITDISNEAIEIVLDLIAENSLYKGNEWEGPLRKLDEMQDEYYTDISRHEEEGYFWSKSLEVGPALSRIRNHSIGVLLQDLTEGKDVLESVKRYEAIVAPHNYKRPKAIFTKRMVEQAEETVKRLGFENSLGRRFAHLSDVTVNNVLFADRDAKLIMGGGLGVFDALKQEATVKPRSFDNVPSMGIGEFLQSVLPNITQLDMLFENRLANNLVSLIAPIDKNAPSMFKWSNGFSWAYAGNIADSAMKQRVQALGGKVDGALRFSIQWNDQGQSNQNDFDAHCEEPNGTHIFFQRLHGKTGKLDVDIIDPGPNVAVENIVITKPENGSYKFWVHNFTNRGGQDGFAAEIEFNGQIYEFAFREYVKHKENVRVAVVQYRNGQFEIQPMLPMTTSSKEVWGLTTNQFHRVSLVSYSPNYWDNQNGIGHRHYFFMLANCTNDKSPNGFYNEYLKENLLEHKRVFAALGSKMKVEHDDNQLSGIGFSSTRRNSVVVRVDNNKVYKIVF